MKKGLIHRFVLLFLSGWIYAGTPPECMAQQKLTDMNTPLHALQPSYPVPYRVPASDEIRKKLDEVYQYLEAVTPFSFVQKESGLPVTASDADTNTVWKKADFRLTSYEWGVTYAGMIAAGKATGEEKFITYTADRLRFIADAYPYLSELYKKYPRADNPLRSVIDPKALDDAGAMCAAIIKTIALGGNDQLRVLSDNFIRYISSGQYRLHDGTLARERPLHNTLWLDDLFMSVPALAQEGKLTGNAKYFDDAARQILLFSARMFDHKKNLYIHGWSASTEVHPAFYWARANGWAIMSMVELLDVLPLNHPSRSAILKQLKLHVQGLAACQSDKGFWHQLLDRNDSYLETSATAIYCYAIAKAINQKWIDAKAYSPMCVLAWNAVSTKINGMGQVEGTCVGTGMGFDPAFYYYRPTSVYAAHGYGPVLLAGAEMIRLIQQHKIGLNDMAIHVAE